MEYARFLDALHLVIGVTTPARVVVPRVRTASGNGVSPCARRSTCMQLVMCRKENFLKINDCSLVRVRVGVRVKG